MPPTFQPQPDPHFTEFVRTGCGESFARLVSRHAGAVYAAALRILDGHSGLAADVTQAVFIELARKAPSLPRDLVVGAWLHRQTVRAALNLRRGEARRAARERAAFDLLLMNAPDPSAEELAATLAPHIDRAVCELPETDRRVLALRFFERCELGEIGERLGLSAGAAQKRLARALEKLRVRLARRGVTPSVSALTLWLNDGFTREAPAGLTDSIAATAASFHTATSSSAGISAHLLTAMASFKSVAAGIVLGLLTGAAWFIPEGKHRAAFADDAGVPTPPPFLADSAAIKHSGVESPVPAPAATAEGLLAQLLDITAAPDHELTRRRLAVWLERVPPELWEPLTALANDRLSKNDRARWLPELARWWALVNAPEAILSLARLRGYAPADGGALAAKAFREWQEADPDAARRWLVERQEDPRLSEYALPEIVSVIAERLAGESEEAALRWASRLQGDDLREAALKPVWEKLTREGGAAPWGEVCGMVLQHEDREFSRLALDRVLGSWTSYAVSREAGGAAADRWLATLPTLEEKRHVAESILDLAIRSHGGSRPENALVTVAASGSQAAVETVTRLLERPAYRNLDNCKWLWPLIDEPEREAHIFRIARQLSGKSVDASGFYGTLRWAAELQDPAVRDPMIYGIMHRWLGSEAAARNPDEIKQWLPEEQFSPEVLVVLNEARNDFEAKPNP